VKVSVVTAIAVAAAATAVPAGALGGAPTLALLGRDPVSVRGSDFRPLERVTVTATANGRSLSRHVRASRAGGFVVRFDLVASRCGGLGIRAARPSGATIWLKLPLPACMPERAPAR